MRRPDARWVHAAKVALAATAVVGAVALLLVLAVNTLIERNLTRDIDSRLATVLSAAAAAPPGSIVSHVRGGTAATSTTSPPSCGASAPPGRSPH